MSESERDPMTPEQKAEWLRSLKRKMITLAGRLAIVRSADLHGELEKLANLEQRYQEHFIVCLRFIPKWAGWFKDGGEYPAKE